MNVGSVGRVGLVPPNESDRLLLHTAEEVLSWPKPDWLIDGLIPRGAFVLLFAPTSIGKTFLMLDWALSLSIGQAWQDRAVAKTKVLCVMAEGRGGLPERLGVWIGAHGRPDLSNFRLIDCDVQFVYETDEFLRAIDDFRPDVVLIDPFIDCFDGLDENLTRDVRQFVAAIRRLKGAPWRPTVIVSHHTGWETKHERGSSALRSAADVVLALEGAPNSSARTLRFVKTRDGAKGDTVSLALTPAAHEVNGRLYESCVVSEPGEPEQRQSNAIGAGPLGTLRALLGFPEHRAATKPWQQAAKVQIRTLHDHRDQLVRLGFVTGISKGSYQATDEGRRVGSANAT